MKKEFNMVKKITLGCTARDIVSGLTGVAVSRAILLTGIVQYNLQPKVKKTETDKLPETIGFDENVLEWVDKGVSENALPLIDPPLLLGEDMADLVNGFVGRAVRRVEFLNGCVWFELESLKPTKDGHHLTHFVDAARLKRTGAGLSKMFALVDTGGPVTRGAPR